jgi:hypothetical protein
MSRLENKKKERWQVLCERIAAEHDPVEFTGLVGKLNAALEEREAKERRKRAGRLKAAHSKPPGQRSAK